MALRERKTAGNLMRKHQITMCGELALEEDMDPS
jgi:hypothetical protein